MRSKAKTEKRPAPITPEKSLVIVQPAPVRPQASSGTKEITAPATDIGATNEIANIQPLVLQGVRIGINYRGPLGNDSYGNNWVISRWGDYTVSKNMDRLAKDFIMMKNHGINSVRINLADDGVSLLDQSCNVTGYDNYFRENIRSFLKAANRAGIDVEFCLADFLIAERRHSDLQEEWELMR